MKLGRYYDGGPNSSDSAYVADTECNIDTHRDGPDTDAEQLYLSNFMKHAHLKMKGTLT